MLPFQTIQETEASLGRSLSYGETLWFDWTSPVPDFLLYFFNFFLVMCVFSFCPLPMALLELKGPKFLHRFKVQPRTRTPWTLMLKTYKDVMLQFVLVVGPLHFLSYPFIKMAGIRTSLPLPSAGEVAAHLTVYFLVEDYGSYWLHRWLHSEWGYDHIHHVHHEFTSPTALAAPYAHWAEILILGIPTFVGPAVAPCHMLTLWFWSSLRQMEAIETHCGYDFPWSPTKLVPLYGGPDYHDHHHSIGRSSHSNFASVFTYCDWIYGTDKGYQYKKQLLQKMKKMAASEDNGEMHHNLYHSFKTV